jgi:hypothetical protein
VYFHRRGRGRPLGVSNAPACTGPLQAPMPSHYAAQNLVVAFKTSGSADQNTALHDPSLSWRAPRTEKARPHS